MAGEVDITGLVRKVVRINSAIKVADARAQRDAAKQTKTLASTIVRETLNMTKKNTDKDLFTEKKQDRWRFRASYKQPPAHRFGGYKPPHRLKSGKAKYLKVKFTRGKEPLEFRRGFAVRRGGTDVAFQRSGKSRYPIELIVGPSTHSRVVDEIKPIKAKALGAYKRRLEHHTSRLIKRAL